MLGVAPGHGQFLVLWLEVANRRPRQLIQSMKALLRRRQGEPHFLRSRQQRTFRALSIIGCLLACLQLRDSRLHARLPLTQSRLIGHLGLESFSHLVEIVRQQSQSRITHVGLNNYGAARNLRLLTQRLQLTTKFGGEVLQPREVALHRIEFA